MGLKPPWSVSVALTEALARAVVTLRPGALADYRFRTLPSPVTCWVTLGLPM